MKPRHATNTSMRQLCCAVFLAVSCGGDDPGNSDAGSGHDDAGDHARDVVADVLPGTIVDANMAIDGPGVDGREGPADVPVAPFRPSIPLTSHACAASWRVIYTPEPQELPPTYADMQWQGSTLFVGRSSRDYAWVFSMPGGGGPRNLLYEGRHRGYWVDDDQLLYAQNYDMFTMPVDGGPPSKAFRYGGPDYHPLSADSLGNRILDREALYWTFDNGGGTWINKRARSGGADVVLARMPFLDADGRIMRRAQSVKDQLLFTLSSDIRGSMAITIAKSDGARVVLPSFRSVSFPAANGTLLNSSAAGVLLWTARGARDVHPDFVYGVGSTDGTPPVPFPAQIPREAIPLAAWPAADGGWYVGTSERDPLHETARYASVWFARPDGTARRVACDPVTGAYPTSPDSRSDIGFASGVAGDGQFYVAVAHPNRNWVLARIENPDAISEPRDRGPRPDAGVGTDAGAGCPVPPPFDSSGHPLTEFPIPTPKAGGNEIKVGPDNNLWFNENGAGNGKLARITTSGCITEFPASAADFTAGPDGKLWFTTRSGDGDRIGRIEADWMFLRLFRLSRGAFGPNGIVAGPDGNLWFTQSSPSAVVRITTDGVLTPFPTKAAFSQPNRMLVGPDGHIWFTNFNASTLGRLNPADGTIVEFQIREGGKAVALANASDGNIWMSVFEGPTRWVMTKVTTTGVITEVPLPYSGVYGDMTKGPDGNLWFTMPPVGKIARLVPATGEMTEFPTSSTTSDPRGITTGPDGNLWFVENGAGKIGRFTP